MLSYPQGDMIKAEDPGSYQARLHNAIEYMTVEVSTLESKLYSILENLGPESALLEEASITQFPLEDSIFALENINRRLAELNRRIRL